MKGRTVSRIAILFCIGAFASAACGLYTPDASRRVLETKYLSGPADYQEVGGARLRVVISGARDAPAVILLHGFGSSLETWEPWAEALSRQFRVIRLDLPGFGLTGPDPTGDYSDARAVQLIALLMDHLGLARASLIGHSLGGRIAWTFAALRPDRVDKLVLISPDGFASPGFAYGRAPKLPWMLRLLPYTLPRPLLRMNLAQAYGNPKALSDATLDRYSDFLRAPGVRRAVLARMGQVVLHPPEPLLRRIQAPTLLLWGRKDAMIPFANAADYERNIVGARLVALAGLGHVPFEEDPAGSLGPVERFLAPH